MSRFLEYGKYALMLNAQTTKISKRLTHLKPIWNNEIVNCHSVNKPFDLSKYKKSKVNIDCNYIDLFPHQIE